MAGRRFDTPMIRLGGMGLDLRASADARSPLAATILTNLSDEYDGELRVRGGLTSLATAAGAHHSVARLNDPSAGVGTYTRYWGVGTGLYRGASGALTLIEGSFSGTPLTFLPCQFLSGDADWMIVADTAKVRKVRYDGTILPLGIAAPTNPVTAAVQPLATTGLAAFDASDGTASGSWTATAGTDAEGNASGAPTLSTVVGLSGNALQITTAVGAATGGYFSLAGISRSINASVLSGGALDASDTDLVHLWMRVDRPDYLQEVRLYFVVDGSFSATVVPGTSASANQDAYVKAFRGSDLTGFVQQRVAATRAAETTVLPRTVTHRFLKDAYADEGREDQAYLERVDTRRTDSVELAAGVDQWTEFGVVGIPLRRGDFQRIGTDTSRTWANITGIIVVVQTSADQSVVVTLDDCFLAGGYGPDSSQVGADQYDWRATHYDPRTGEESNPSPIMSTFVDARRQRVLLTPQAHSDANMRQRFYRRGGTLGEDWFYVDVNASNGGTIYDTAADTELEASATLEQDNDQLVATVDSSGATVLAQPVRVVLGPVQGLYFAFGDPHRPGAVYYSKVDKPGSWPAERVYQACPGGEELLNGCVWGGQAYAFSREMLYGIHPHLSGEGIEVTPTACKLGLAGPWALTTSPRYGILFVGATAPGIYSTTGGPPVLLSGEIQPLFEGETVHGLDPVDWTVPNALRLTVWRDRVFFTYQSTTGGKLTLVGALWKNELRWRVFAWGVVAEHLTAEAFATDAELILGGDGASYTYDPLVLTDAGGAIAWHLRTGEFDAGRPREDKLLGDLVLDLDRGSTSVAVTTRLNHGATVNGALTITTGSGRQRVIQDPFGTVPQEARTIALDLSGTSSLGKPILYQAGVSLLIQPDRTIQRATDWDDLNEPGEKIVTGVILDCNTFNVAKAIAVEMTRGSAGPTVVATLTVTANGRHRVTFSGLSGVGDLIRLRPTDTVEWELFNVSWIYKAIPPRQTTWDSFEQTYWDTYYTGLDLDIDTAGASKTIEVTIDGSVIVSAATVSAAGRRVVHLTLPAGRGHVYRFRSTDTNAGTLYGWRWHLAPEPSEQHNWNQNFTLAGTLADKWVKGVILDCLTSADKGIALQVEGATLGSEWQTTINTGGERKVVNWTFPQTRARTLRLVPLDTVPGRLYQVRWIYDEEPYALSLWESQETDHGVGGWFIPRGAWIAVRVPSSPMYFTLAVQLWQEGGGWAAETYPITATAQAGGKCVVYVPFRGRKGVLARYTLRPALPTPPTTQFWVYREECLVQIQPWDGRPLFRARPFGTDGLSETQYAKRHQGGSDAPDARVGTVEGRPEPVSIDQPAPPSF